MAYVVAPLINWGSVKRAVSRGASWLRREARALGVIGGGGGASRCGGVCRTVIGSAPGAGAAQVGLTACAECGINPANVSNVRILVALAQLWTQHYLLRYLASIYDMRPRSALI